MTRPDLKNYICRTSVQLRFLWLINIADLKNEIKKRNPINDLNLRNAAGY